MAEEAKEGTRDRLLLAAVAIVASSPGADISLRAVCKEVGVAMPTLYHFFGSKEGLIDEVIGYGFDLYYQEKKAYGSTGDPIQDLRRGWDGHVEFGLANPGLYTLMYGRIRPGYSPPAQEGPHGMLRQLTTRAEEAGRLVVTSEDAATHILTTIVGLTFRQINLQAEDRRLTVTVREAVLAAITGTSGGASVEDCAREILEYAAARPDVLAPEETQLLALWLRRITATEE